MADHIAIKPYNFACFYAIVTCNLMPFFAIHVIGLHNFLEKEGKKNSEGKEYI